jgi:hypothetical protein
MTTTNVAKQPNENRGKIGPWDELELVEAVCAMREIASSLEILLEVRANGGDMPPDENIEQVRRALLELTKALAGTVVAGAPELAGELARAFFVISGAHGVRKPESATPATAFEPLSVAVLSTETRKHEATGHTVDVALVRISFNDAESDASIVDALLIRRDRNNDDRRVRHFPCEVNSQHFERAVECRAQWLGVSDGPFAPSRPCS